MATILVIDDEGSIRRLVRHVLERAGHQVTEAASGDEGMRLFSADPHDLVITDLVMPGQEGIETILKLRKHSPEVRILAMSGAGPAGPSSYLALARSLGARATLAKPFHQSELLNLVTELITT